MAPEGVKLKGGGLRGWVSIGGVKKFASLALQLALTALVFVWGLAHELALGAPVRVEAVEVELVAERDALVPGERALIGLRMRHDPHWHSYWRNPGDSGLPTQVALTLPEGWTAGEIVWPAPQRVFVGPLANYAFEGEILLPIPVEVPRSAAAATVRIAARVQWLMCREVCIPGEADLSLDVPVAAGARPSAHAALFEAAARETPSARLEARAGLGQGVVSLGFESPGVRTAEFFPYREGWLSAPAPQSLYRIGDEASTRWRLELKLLDAVDRDALRRAGFEREEAAVGVLRIDGKPYELRAGFSSEALSGGTLVATAIGTPDERAAGGQGLASRFLSGAGSAGAGSGGQAAAGSAGSLTLLFALAFGLVGGLILNLMPCVFPVIGLKVLGFARHARSHRRETTHGALAFAAGVLVSFWVLAALLLALRAAGEAAGWGFQLQSPPFVALMALLFVLIGLNFAGVFEIGAGMTRLGGVDPLASGQGSLARAFGSGALAVLVATPCTAPFMGSALGYTLGRPAFEVLLVFTAIAFGMALPYLMLGLFPRALAWLPRPGRWMESFKQFLAFPMFATVAWLAWVLGQQAGLDAVLALAVGAVLLALAAWLYGRFVQSAAGTHRMLAAVLAIVSLAAGLWLAWPGESSRGAPGASTAYGPGGQPGGVRSADAWEPWSAARVAAAVGAGQPVFVDFTAAWCVSCQANKALVLSRDPVVAEMRRRKVLQLRADWTNRDPAITNELARHGRNGVPLYLVYVPGESAPRVLPEILTSAVVMDALRAIR